MLKAALTIVMTKVMPLSGSLSLILSARTYGGTAKAIGHGSPFRFLGWGFYQDEINACCIQQAQIGIQIVCVVRRTMRRGKP